MPVIIDYERQAREFLVQESRKRCTTASAGPTASSARPRRSAREETMHLLSSVRMGVNLGLIHDLEIPTINKLFIHTQPAHLQKLRGMELDSADRNIERATYLRRHLSGETPKAGQN